MINVFKKYITNRKKLNSNTKRFYIKKLLFPVFISLPLFYIGIKYSEKMNHSAIATALVSITAIIVAFLVFSLTILLTKENTKFVPNTKIKYMDILINNTEVLALISVGTIILNLVYMYISNLEKCSIFYCDYIINIIGFISMYFTVLIIKIAIDDLLFLSKSYE